MKRVIPTALALLIAAGPAAAQDATLIEEGRLPHPRTRRHADRAGSLSRPSAHMPALELTDDDIRALAAFFASQR